MTFTIIITKPNGDAYRSETFDVSDYITPKVYTNPAFVGAILDSDVDVVTITKD
jgi:hypothetical protein